MNIQIVSDLHLEFHADGGIEFIHSMDPSNVDVLVIAGDLTTYPHLDDVITEIAHRYDSSEIVYVTGNHEFYRSFRDQVVDILRILDDDLPNFHFLDNRIVELDGIKFAGTPLWFEHKDGNEYFEQFLSDFSQIHDYRSWVYEENAKALNFLDGIQADVIVTHHLPSLFSVSSKWRGSDLNRFFVCEVNDIIIDSQAKYWIHGHTHDSCMYTIKDTQVICNPFGYPHEPNKNYIEKLIVGV